MVAMNNLKSSLSTSDDAKGHTVGWDKPSRGRRPSGATLTLTLTPTLALALTLILALTLTLTLTLHRQQQELGQRQQLCADLERNLILAPSARDEVQFGDQGLR